MASIFKIFTFFAFISTAFAYSHYDNEAKPVEMTLTFVANSETRGDGLNPSTMDYFIGSRYPQLSLIISYLKKHGVKVEVVDWEDETIDWLKKDKIILGPVWGYTTNLDKFISWLDRIESLDINLVNHPKFLKWNLIKTYLLDLTKQNISIPNTLIIISESPLTYDEAKSIFNKKFSQNDIILKGVIDSGSFGYMHVQSDKFDEAKDHFEKLKRTHHGVIIQNFIPEIQKKGELSFVFFDDEISHFFVKVPKFNDDRTQPFYGARSFHLTDKNLEKQIEFIQSSFRPDFELEDKDILNARYQAQIVYGKLLLLLEDLSIPPPKYLRIDGVMVGAKFVIMEIEGIEPYLEIQDAMDNDKSNNILQRYAENVLEITIL